MIAHKDINVIKFKKWLTDRGAEIIPPTNKCELIRFKGRKVGVLYKTGKTGNNYTSHTLECFKKNKTWRGKPVSVGRKKSYKKEKRLLLDRDGNAFSIVAYC